MDTLWHLLIGAVAGFLAGLVLKGRGFGMLGNVIVGLIGAFVGGKLAGWLGIQLGEGTQGALITAFAGAVVFLLLLGLIRPGKR
ncbi:MAG: GlsB/YeaQ/YmgE family stress response membrane protein [Planctomycetes bacterium]|nr:GlsB/YeaQ/YmgE family stress response membrane protein [Planctomycetota bacterium]MBL7009157.1 GlsB/YeaQ/YmgE family stress response membrane protein [Planctomycetota bacterium]